MSINFVPRERSSFDEASGVSILRPRILPAIDYDVNGAVEYEYTFLRGTERVGWIGCVGTWQTFGTDSEFSSVYTLDLGSPGVWEDMVRFKREIGNPDEMSVFFFALAEGLINAFAGQTDNSSPVRYMGIISEDVLTSKRIAVPDNASKLANGMVVVAGITVPAHAS